MSVASSLFEPVGEPAGSAAKWLADFLSGTAATAVCVIAVATLGMMMLSGRVSLHRGFQVILGCFLVLGATVISAELRRLATGTRTEAAPAQQVIEVQSSPKPLPRASYDPYAGASLRRQ